MQERVKPKTKKLTVEIDATLAAAAAAKGLDLSEELERALRRLLGSSKAAPSDEDRASMDSYNRFIAEHGTLADAFRKL